MGEGVAVVFSQRTLGRGANMAKDESRSGFGGDSLEVRAVPGWNSRREETRRWTELGVGVETYAKTIRIILTAAGVLG